MSFVQDLHMHCSFCDGHNTMEEMLLSAISKGLNSIGFSSHGPTGFPFDKAAIKANRVDDYFNEIQRVREKYDFPVYAGFEYESRNTEGNMKNKDARCDYAIGSVHFYVKDNKFTFVDATVEQYKENLVLYGGARPLMENYYTEVLDFAKRSDYDITGHFDVVRKFENNADMSFTQDQWYKDLASSTLEGILKAGKIIEVNTGGMARNYTFSPYPSEFLLKRMVELRAPIVISSDAHEARTIASHFEDTVEYLKSLGFKTKMILTKNGFHETAL